MSELVLNCDRCHAPVSSLDVNMNRVGSDWLCPRCLLLDCAEFCRGEGWIGKAMEYEAKVREMDLAKHT